MQGRVFGEPKLCHKSMDNFVKRIGDWIVFQKLVDEIAIDLLLRVAEIGQSFL